MALPFDMPEDFDVWASETPPAPPLPPVDPDKVPQELVKEITEWLVLYLKESREYVKRKAVNWRLIEKLIENDITLSQWKSGTWDSTPLSIEGLFSTPITPQRAWRSEYVHTPSMLAENWADNAYGNIFNGPEWIMVVPMSGDGVTDDVQFPTARKMASLLVERLSESKIKARLYDALFSLAAFGSAYLKIFWYPQEGRNSLLEATKLVEVPDRERPIIQLIPLDLLLPDWTASHNDLERHRGIGHRVPKTVEEIQAGYRSGRYNLNADKFDLRWSRGEGTIVNDLEGRELNTDTDKSGLQDPSRWLELWEWHGSVPTSAGFVELVAVFAVKTGSDDPQSGILIKLIPRPALPSGKRPFACAHFTQRLGPFGMGQIERNKDLLLVISELIAQFIDNVKCTAQAVGTINEDNHAAVKKLKDNGGELRPGMLLPKNSSDPAPIEPLQLPVFPSGEVTNLIQFLISLLERRTSTPDVYQGLSGGEKTATEAGILQQQAAKPTQTRIDIIADNLIGPACTIALDMLRYFGTDFELKQPTAGGGYTNIEITPEEMLTGAYRALCAVSNPDALRIAKIQSLERVTGMLTQYQPMLAAEGTQISMTEMVTRMLDLMEIPGADRILRQVPMAPPGMGPGMPQGPPQGGPAVPGDMPNMPEQLGSGGGPMGQAPTDANIMAQTMQQNAQPGAQY